MKTTIIIHRVFFIAVLLVSSTLIAKEESSKNQELEPIKVGVLKFGTVNWVLDVIKEHQLDKKHGVDIQVVALGSKNATHVAIQGGAADVIVSDWIWVARQRAEKRDYTFVSYSNSVGALMVSPKSNIKTLADLQGKKIGVAGGAVDKTWLLLSAFFQKNQGKQLTDWVKPSFAAPPLLNELALRGDLDGALNFWHYTARLQAAGFISLVSLPDILKELGIDRPIPVIGWVFSDKWATSNSAVTKGFLNAVEDAQTLLIKSDEEWQRIRPKMKAKDDVIFETLKTAFREGIPACFGEDEKQAARSTFAILAKLGGEKLVGKSTELDEGTFWEGYNSTACDKYKNTRRNTQENSTKVKSSNQKSDSDKVATD